jgi:hypothetical protein
MTRLRTLAVAAALAAGLAAPGAAEAAAPNAGNVTPPAATEGEAATPVYHGRRRCWPVHRWVWTHWGWRYRYVGHRCARPHRYHYHPRYHRYRYRHW